MHGRCAKLTTSGNEERPKPGVAIRVLIADRHPIVLAGLRSILGRCSDIQIVGEAVNGPETIDETIQLDPNIVLVDLKLPRATGLTVLRSIRRCAPRSKVILFASSACKDNFVAAMRLGCSGILLKESSTSLIPKSIRKIHAGEIWIDKDTTAAVVRQLRSRSALPTMTSLGKGVRSRVQLSDREREVLSLVAYGLKNRQIAEKMSISQNTVKNYVHTMFQKLGAIDRLELALYAVHEGLHA